MTRRLLAIAFVTWHLTAIVTGALPSPASYARYPVATPDPALGPVLGSVTTAFDKLAWALGAIPQVVSWTTSPVRGLANRYRQLTGLGQSWAMFSNPPQYDEYIRTRYYIRPPSGREWVATELVMPAHREDRVRLVQSFRDSYRDKAMTIAESGFLRRRKASAIRPDTPTAELPDDIAPIGRYFARRFAERQLKGTGEQIVRTEVWIGKASTVKFGEQVNQGLLDARRAALQAYYEGPVEQRLLVPPRPPYHGGEVEADIYWVLEYYEEP